MIVQRLMAAIYLMLMALGIGLSLGCTVVSTQGDVTVNQTHMADRDIQLGTPQSASIKLKPIKQ